jgi:energy-coupling factor transport system ATP-binding protein
MIEIREVTFCYPGGRGSSKPVFQRFNLKIPRGRYMTVMGPNGSGKSTLGKMIKGILAPSSGQILIAGEPLKPQEISSSVGYMFSNPENQIVSSIVEEDVAFGLANRGIDSASMLQRVQESLRFVGMEARRFHAPHMLSGGEQQKVILAGILAMESEVLVLDEPTSMLDPQARSEILALLAEIQKQGILTILHITHFFEEALIADELLYLEEGQIRFQGSAWDFLVRHAQFNFPRESCPSFYRLLEGLRERGHRIPVEIRTEEALQRFLAEQKTEG